MEIGQSENTSWNAESYHRVGNPQFAWGLQVLDRLRLRGNETVMDAGCGTGRLTAELLERLPEGKVIAVDASLDMIHVARGFLTPRFGSRVSFLHADLQLLSLDESVDAIFSTATLHWITDHRRLFRSLYDALKPGGQLVAQCGGGPNLARLYERAKILMSAELYAPYFAAWTEPWEFADEATTAERLHDAGFVDVETSLMAAPTVLRDAHEYNEFLTTVIFRLHLACLPNDALRQRFIASLTDEAAGDEPPFSLDYWRLNMYARRPD